MAVNNSSSGNKSPRKSFKLYGVIFLVVAAGVAAVWLKVVRGSQSDVGQIATFAAKRGPLRISVLEAGTIKAREQEVIYNQVEGKTTIVSIVAEGSIVKAGDLLVELDVSTLKDLQIDREITVQNANAALVNATENLEIVKNQAISDVNVAALTLLFAKQDLEKYKSGEFPNQLENAQSKITLAKEQLTRAEQTLGWSERLYKEKYIAETELQGDRLTRNRSQVDVNIAQNDLELLQKYTYNREIAQRESDVRQAEMALDRVQRRTKANVVQAEADLTAKQQEYNRQKQKLAKIEDQIAKARIVAPREGMVIYATSAQSGGGGRGRMDNRQPLMDGVEVTERQELIYLPTAASSKAEVGIHEASMQKVHVGLPAVITVDALQGKQFFGTVAKIAPLPDPQSMFMNPDLKIYNSDIWLEAEDPSLRTGMSCKVEIIVAEYADAIYVPVQTVLRVEGKPTVFVAKPDGSLEERKVEIGLDNSSMVRVVSGLSEGEQVSLTPPLKAADAQLGEAANGSGDPNDAAMTQQINRRLDGSDGFQAPGLGQRQGGQGGVGGMGGMRGGRGFDPNMTPDQLQQRIQRMIENAAPEQRQQLEDIAKKAEGLSDLAPDERQKTIQTIGRQLQGLGLGRGSRGGGRGQGRGQNAGGPEGGQ
jgi:HlyD family secretion protein